MAAVWQWQACRSNPTAYCLKHATQTWRHHGKHANQLDNSKCETCRVTIYHGGAAANTPVQPDGPQFETCHSPLFEPCHANMAVNRAFQPIQPDSSFRNMPSKKWRPEKVSSSTWCSRMFRMEKEKESRPTAPNWLQSPEQEAFCPLPWALLMNSKDSTDAASQDDQ